MRLDYKNKVNRFLPSFFELGKLNNLDGNVMQVYGYIYNVCMQLNDDGYCGYSNEKMATALGLETRTFKRYLKALKDKELILVDNPRKRAVRAGKSRMIRINPHNYIAIQEQINFDDIERENYINTIKRLEEEIALLKQKGIANEVGNIWVSKLYKKGFFTTEEYNNAHMYNVLFDELLKETDWAWCEKVCINWDKDPSEVKDKYAYVCASIKNQIKRYDQLREEVD